MISSQEYLERLKAMKPNVYMGGEPVSRDHPLIMPGIRVIALTYDLAQDPQYQELLTATSHLSGERINRFTHIHQSPEDLLKKQEMTRVLTRKTGFCIQRCMGVDAMNALSVVTQEMDDRLGTEYHQRFLNYLEYWQEKDITGCCAQTDAKGHRKLRPHQQPDPDAYVRVVKKDAKGIVVRGAKRHITVGSYAEEIIVLPTRVMTPEEKDWAVAFAVPGDAQGLYLVNRASAPRPRKHLKAPLASFGSSDTLTIFEDVFVPWERVFMCGETEFAGDLALLFALFHRHSYTGCKPAVTDVIMGFTALAAEYHGIEKAQHIQMKLADLIGVAELVYGAGIAAGVKAKKSSSGTWIPDPVFCNVGRRHAGEHIYHEHHILSEVAGGIPATLPYEDDFFYPELGELVNKYTRHRTDIPAEYQHRCFRCIGDLAVSAFGGVWQYAGVHGGGSPIMETIALLKNYDLEEKKQVAKELAGIPLEEKSKGGP